MVRYIESVFFSINSKMVRRTSRKRFRSRSRRRFGKRRRGGPRGLKSKFKGHGSHLTGSTRKIAKRAMSKVSRISIPEVKRVFPSITAPGAVAQGAFKARQINGVSQGSTISTRIGSKIKVMTIQVAFSLSTDTVAALPGQIRTSSFLTVMLVKFKDKITTTVAGVGLPDIDVILTRPTEPELSFFVEKQSTAHKEDYKVLMKKMYVVNPRYTTTTVAASPDTYALPGDSPFGKQFHFFNFKVPQNEQVTYINLSDSDTANNGLVLYWANSANGGIQNVNIGDFVYKILFMDS